MTVLSEQVRDLTWPNEANLVNDATDYERTSSSWGTLKDYGNVTLSADSVVAFKFTRSVENPTGYARLKVGTRYVWADKWTSGTANIYGVVYLAAGTYNVLMEAAGVGTTAHVHVSAFQMGRFKFSDTDGEALQTYTAQLSVTLAARQTPLGTLQKGMLIITCYATTAADVTNWENNGETLANGVNCSIDGNVLNWNERVQDTGSPYYYAFARSIWRQWAGTHTISFSKRNANTVVTFSVVYCPWILDADTGNDPIDLDVPDGSTVYVTLEPLGVNVTKTASVGVPRGIDFGVNYYKTESATGIQYFSYTFEYITVDVGLFVSGLGGCISNIAVDIR